MIYLSIWHNNAGLIWKDKWASWNLTTEFDVVKPIVDALVKIDNRFVKVPEWLTLTQRIKWINKNCLDGDYTVEFHLDSWWTATWCSTWYMSWSDFAKKKAEKFQMEYTKQTWLIGRWVHGDLTNRLKRLAFVRDTRPLALLVELGFISNTKDLKIIKEKWVQAIYNSLIKL